MAMLQKLTVALVSVKIQSIAVQLCRKIFQTKLNIFQDFTITFKDHIHFQVLSRP